MRRYTLTRRIPGVWRDARRRLKNCMQSAGQLRMSYLFKMTSISPRTACRGYAFPFAIVPCADGDAPLGTMARVPVSFRFATDGEAGAGGSDGGVRVPLAVAMVTTGAVGDARVMPLGVERASAAAVVVRLSPSPPFPFQQNQKERCCRERRGAR